MAISPRTAERRPEPGRAVAPYQAHAGHLAQRDRERPTPAPAAIGHGERPSGKRLPSVVVSSPSESGTYAVEVTTTKTHEGDRWYPNTPPAGWPPASRSGTAPKCWPLACSRACRYQPGRQLPVLVRGHVEADRRQGRRQGGRGSHPDKPPPAGAVGGRLVSRPTTRDSNPTGLPGRGQEQRLVGHLGELCNMLPAAATSGEVLERPARSCPARTPRGGRWRCCIAPAQGTLKPRPPRCISWPRPARRTRRPAAGSPAPQRQAHNGRMAAWPHGRMAAWPHGRMAAWPHGRAERAAPTPARRSRSWR
jgi:hypothetical protein